jgi:glycerol-3-phosphate cytidylyltransferase
MHFTIITPSLNYGRFLGDCLASVAAQTGVSLEHLVIDGGSTDHSAEEAARFAHVTWIQEPDDGMSDAINKGFERARGEWVMWLNADDRLKPGALVAMVPLLEKSTADVVYGNWDFVDEHGIFLRHVKSLPWSRFVHVHHHCFIGSTAAFYRKSTVIEGGHRLRRDFRYVMDGEFYARLDAAGMGFEHVPLTVADFRMHGGNLSQRHRGMTRDMDRILAAERQYIESRAIRRAYGVTLFEEPYLNGIVDGFLWLAAKAWKVVRKWQGGSFRQFFGSAVLTQTAGEWIENDKSKTRRSGFSWHHAFAIHSLRSRRDRATHFPMKKVITYGTYDLLHRGHINLLKRAKAMGDYLVVGLSSDEFNAGKDKKSFYSYEERKLVLEAVRYVDEVIPENTWEQKAADIAGHEINIFVMGDDWQGKFDHLSDLCEVVYLPRTEGVSTTETKAHLRLTESSNIEFTE